ncbi:hypothetical protein J1N35_001030, partial [Gossypium stocksii]
IGRCIDWAALDRVQLADVVRALLNTEPWEQFFYIVEPTYLELTLELCSTFHLQVTTSPNGPGTIQFRLGGLVRRMSIPEFGIALGLYTDEFIVDEDFPDLPCRIHISPVKCWQALVPRGAIYNPSRAKATTLAPSMRYIHAMLAYTLTGRCESTSVVSTHDAYFLWSMPFNTKQSDIARALSPWAYTLHGWAAISGFSIPQPRRLRTHSSEGEDPEDIPDDVPPPLQEEDAPAEPPPPRRPSRATATYADISERLSRFEQ